MTTTPLPDTWHARDLPVLREVVRLWDEGVGIPVSTTTVEQNLGLGEDDVQRAGIALSTAGLVETLGVDEWPVTDFIAVSARARQLAGAWPTEETALDRMIAALQAIADNTDEDQDTRTRARRVLDGLTGAGRQIGVAVAAAAITGQLPGTGA